MKPLKILNLNLWNYNNWAERKPMILSFIRKHDPDVIAFQEVRDDLKFNRKGSNQAEQLNEELAYPYLAFYPVTDKKKERPEKYKHYCIEGTAILSKFPILKVEMKELKKHPDDRYTCGNLYVRVKTDSKAVDIVAVHFSNSDLFSLLHLIETIKWIKTRRINPIIAGDFNMWHQDWLDDLTEDNFRNSWNYKRYISYPIRTNGVHANWTLDYILIPKEFKFKSLKCFSGLSDHKAMVAEIEII